MMPNAFDISIWLIGIASLSRRGRRDPIYVDVDWIIVMVWLIQAGHVVVFKWMGL